MQCRCRALTHLNLYCSQTPNIAIGAERAFFSQKQTGHIVLQFFNVTQILERLSITSLETMLLTYWCSCKSGCLLNGIFYKYLTQTTLRLISFAHLLSWLFLFSTPTGYNEYFCMQLTNKHIISKSNEG